MRTLSVSFFNNLQNGLLNPILNRVQNDRTLMLAIRGNYINIYYRGGNLLKLEEQTQDSYKAFFDEKYNKSGMSIPNLPREINNSDDLKLWVEAFPSLKEIMDFFFSKHDKPEREFQQLVARENNNSTISNETEYFISDIEFADPTIGARLDMLGIRWLASQRKDGTNCRAALIEMKYGDNALDGNAGLLKHLDNIASLVEDNERCNLLLAMMEEQFNQLLHLNLLRFNKSEKVKKIKIDKHKPEVIFLLANHNPRSTKLRSLLNDDKFGKYDQSGSFHLKFSVTGFAGYGLHADYMLTLNEFKEFLDTVYCIKPIKCQKQF